jgi:hypothetical protein
MNGRKEIIISGCALLLGVILIHIGNLVVGLAITKIFGFILCLLGVFYILARLCALDDNHKFCKFWEHRFILLVLGAIITIQSVNYEHLFTLRVADKEKQLEMIIKNIKEGIIERQKLSSDLTLSISDRLSYMRPVYYNLRDDDSHSKLKENYSAYQNVKDKWNKIWQDYSLKLDVHFSKDKFPPDKFITRKEKVKFIRKNSFKEIFEWEIQDRLRKMHDQLLKYKDSYLSTGIKLSIQEKKHLERNFDELEDSYEVFRQILAGAINYSNNELEKRLNEKPETVVPGNTIPDLKK